VRRKRPTPERCVEAYHLQWTRFESIPERKLRRRQLTDDQNAGSVGGICAKCQIRRVPTAGEAETYLCFQTFTADSTRMTASSGGRTPFGTTPSKRPPRKLPRIEPAAITSTNRRFSASTMKLRSLL
jgi:hypothetical protein